MRHGYASFCSISLSQTILPKLHAQGFKREFPPDHLRSCHNEEAPARCRSESALEMIVAELRQNSSDIHEDLQRIENEWRSRTEVMEEFHHRLQPVTATIQSRYRERLELHVKLHLGARYDFRLECCRKRLWQSP